MDTVLLRSACFAAIIVLGYVLRRTGVFGPEAFRVLADVVMKVTLPCAIIVNFTGRALPPAMLGIVLIGLGSTLLAVAVAAVCVRRSPEEKAFAMVNWSGGNIGTFALPFVQSFLGAEGVMAASLFDVGNGTVCLGGSYSLACAAKDRGGFSLRLVAKKLSSSVAIITHITMTVLTLLHITLPSPVVECARIAANANVFLSMLMLGVGFKVEARRDQVGAITAALAVRYALAAAVSVACWYLLPFSHEVRLTVVVLLFAPAASANPVFTREMNGDVGLSSAISSVSCVTSVVIIVALLSILG